jgi:hypothetical protein
MTTFAEAFPSRSRDLRLVARCHLPSNRPEGADARCDAEVSRRQQHNDRGRILDQAQCHVETVERHRQPFGGSLSHWPPLAGPTPEGRVRALVAGTGCGAWATEEALGDLLGFNDNPNFLDNGSAVASAAWPHNTQRYGEHAARRNVGRVRRSTRRAIFQDGMLLTKGACSAGRGHKRLLSLQNDVSRRQIESTS